MRVVHIYVSPGHNYLGHHGQPAGDAPIVEVDEVQCVAGQGLEGDRFFGHKEDYKGQITFFDLAVHLQLVEKFGSAARSPAIYRRNVIVDGMDLNSLIGQEFEVQGVRFQGVEECRPCYWMDQALAPGAEEAMKGQGGLRARIMTSGILRKSA